MQLHRAAQATSCQGFMQPQCTGLQRRPLSLQSLADSCSSSGGISRSPCMGWGQLGAGLPGGGNNAGFGGHVFPQPHAESSVVANAYRLNAESCSSPGSSLNHSSNCSSSALSGRNDSCLHYAHPLARSCAVVGWSGPSLHLRHPATSSSGRPYSSVAVHAAPTEAQVVEQARKQRIYSPLHKNIEEFCQKIVPTEGEIRQKHEAVEGIKACVRKAFPTIKGVNVEVFGSFANGLSTWSSDVDLVVTGLLEPDRHTGGYDVADRGRVTARLRKIADQLRSYKKLEMMKTQLIPRARIPILRLYTKAYICLDISISDDTGPRAARYMGQQARAFPPMKPLVLVLKAFLKSQRLHEVREGGLSSYSLNNMVIAHMQEELKNGRDIYDLGETLYSFLLRYGEEFDYESEAVSVGSGGVVPKAALGFAMDSARNAAASQGMFDGATHWYQRLCVDCPLTGRDVSNGTYRIDLIREAFIQASRKLEALARGRKPTDTSINYLQALFDVQRIVKRSQRVVHEDAFIKTVAREEEVITVEESVVDEGEDEDVLDSLPTASVRQGGSNSNGNGNASAASGRGSGGSKGGARGKGSRN